MPTVKQYQKGGIQEKPLGAGHYKTTTGKVVVWGTPEYREAYDKGEVVTDRGVKSPVTIQGGTLPEVVVKNNYKRGFWEKYKDKIVEENKDSGVLGAIVGTPISAVASLPQLAMMEGLTGKVQRPSEAMNIQNPYGAMAVDAVTDPANLIGAGVLTKEKVLAGLARSTEDGLLSNAYKLNPFAFKPNPEAYYRTLGKEGIDDAFNSGVIRPKQTSNIYSPEIGKRVNVNSPEFPEGSYFNKGSIYSDKKMYNPDYMAEVVGKDEAFTRPPRTVFNENIRVAPNNIPIEEANFYKKDWLQGYKQVEVPKNSIEDTKTQPKKAGASYLATQGQEDTPKFEKGGQKQDKERIAYSFLTAQGWTPEQTIGIIGNIKRESGFNPNAVGDAGKAFGLVQWHPDRQAKAKSLYGDNWKSFENQLRFIDWELRNTEKAAGDKLKNTKNVWQAGQVVSDFYERPQIKFVGDETRQTHVADAAMKFKGIKLTPEDNINYGVTFENSVAPYMNAPQVQATPLPTLQVPQMQTQQVSYLETPIETTNLATETEQKQSKINPQEEAFMQDLLSQMAQGVAYIEPEKSAVFQNGGKIPVSSNGMYEYPNQKVIIPSSRITMKDINHPILAITDQGDKQILQPEKEYQLKGNSTLEIPLTQAEENFLKDIYKA